MGLHISKKISVISAALTLNDYECNNCFNIAELRSNPPDELSHSCRDTAQVYTAGDVNGLQTTINEASRNGIYGGEPFVEFHCNNNLSCLDKHLCVCVHSGK